MSVFSDMFDAAAGGVLYATHGQSVSYVHQANPAASLAEDSQTYTMIRQSSPDVGGGSRQQHQPVIWRLLASDASRAPERGDTISDGADVWTVFDVTLKGSGTEYRLNTVHIQPRA